MLPRTRLLPRSQGFLSTLWVPSLLIWVAASCRSPEDHRASADEEVYALIEARKVELFQDSSPFTIEPNAASLRDKLEAGEEISLDSMNLVDCLAIAAANSRDYQARKERLYLTALDLTLEQWRFDTQFGAILSGTVNGDGDGAQSATADGQLTVSRVLGTGASIVSNIGSSLFRVLTTGDGWDALSDISLSVTQPLLRGAGRAIVREPLTQAQRDLIYEVRDFERFRRTFALQVVRQFYRLLLANQNVANEEANRTALEQVRLRNEALAEAGQVSDIQVDQAKQEELRSNNQLVELSQSLARQIDDFKFFLGLPLNTELSLDTEELSRLVESLDQEDPVLGKFSEEKIVAMALSNRLDYLNTVDSVFDAERRVMVAADGLEAGLDFQASINSSTPEGQPFRFRSDGVGWSAGLSLDLPIDQLPERNAYRRALIDQQATLRSLEESGDSIEANLRDLLREADATMASYRIQENAVTLAERRVESANLNLEAGRAETRDLLEAQEALLASQNAAFRALVDYALARLDLYSEMEVLTVDETGIGVDNAILEQSLAENQP
ncbi:MAG: TolC family protein [Planctomycetota bacterium]|nr:MAG: TolC family protein [Planctomycetota bacterium]